jgi:hypothetical protein
MWDFKECEKNYGGREIITVFSFIDNLVNNFEDVLPSFF